MGGKRAYRGRLGKDRSPRHSRHSAQRAQLRERALLVRPGEPAVADDILDQDRRALAALAHPSGTPALRMSSMIRSRRFR
jgi:hypothetical protein